MTSAMLPLPAPRGSAELASMRDKLGVLASAAEMKDWSSMLNARKLAELDFHNRDRDASGDGELSADELASLKTNRKYYRTVAQSQNFVGAWLRQRTPGLVFLDYACGNGAKVIAAAKHGAGLSIGLDISDVSVHNGRRAAAAAGVADRCVFVQGDCENTGLPDRSIDVILCSGMLHHLDLSYAFPELRRILRPGGRILAVEALNYNPLIRAYRMLTPEMRTDWEKRHILSLADVRFASRFFDIGDVRYWHVLSPLAAWLPGGNWQRPALAVLDGLDSVLTAVPGLRLMAWQFTFELIGRAE